LIEASQAAGEAGEQVFAGDVLGHA